jgi:hypothetical protein
MDPIYVMLILLNAHTGEEISRRIESGPYASVDECTKAQMKSPTIDEVVLTTEPPQIAVHECAISHVDKSS